MPVKIKARSQVLKSKSLRKRNLERKSNKEYKFRINKKNQSSNVFWWKTETRHIATIWDEVNKFNWLIYVGNTLQPAIDSYCKILNIKSGWEPGETEGRTGHFFAYRPHRAAGIWFERPPKNQQGVVAHECLHAVMYLLERLESRATEDQEEFIAYYLGFLVDQVHTLCKDLA